MERRLERVLATAGLALVLGLAGLPAAAYHYGRDSRGDIDRLTAQGSTASPMTCWGS